MALTTISFIRTAVAVFDRQDPRKLISRSEAPVFAPEREWEKVGQVPKRPSLSRGWSQRAVPEDVAGHWDYFLFYYGAADKYVGVAEARVTSPLTDGTH